MVTTISVVLFSTIVSSQNHYSLHFDLQLLFPLKNMHFADFASSYHDRIPNSRICYMQVFGTATKPLIFWLLPPKYRSLPSLSPNVSLDADFHIPLLMDTERDENGITERTGISRIFNGLPPQSLTMLLTAPRSKIHHVWRKFDDAYMRPMFGGRGYVRLISRRSMGETEEPIETLENEDHT